MLPIYKGFPLKLVDKSYKKHNCQNADIININVTETDFTELPTKSKQLVSIYQVCIPRVHNMMGTLLNGTLVQTPHSPSQITDWWSSEIQDEISPEKEWH